MRAFFFTANSPPSLRVIFLARVMRLDTLFRRSMRSLFAPELSQQTVSFSSIRQRFNLSRQFTLPDQQLQQRF